MTAAFCMLFPAFAGVLFICCYQKKVTEMPRLPIWVLYGGITLTSNIVVFLVLVYVMGYPNLVLDNNIFHLTFALRYIALSVVVGIILSWIWCLFASRRFRIKVLRKDRQVTKPLKAGRKVLRGICLVFLFIALLLIFGSNWLVHNFSGLTPEKLIFHLNVPLKGADQSQVVSGLVKGVLPAVLCFIAIVLLTWLPVKRELRLHATWRTHDFGFAFLPFHKLRQFFEVFSAAMLIFALLFSNSLLNYRGYISYFTEDSPFIQEHYVDPNSISLSFPEEKRNLIFIYLESMEPTYLSRELGGVCDNNLIPEIYSLGQQNLSFGDTDVGSILPGTGTQWTVGGMVASMAGLPLRVATITGNPNDYGSYSSFMPGARMLGDILMEEGYTQEFLMGSYASFCGRDSLLQEHGDYTIKDYSAAVKDGIIPEDYYVWWGFEDKYLYTYAQQELTDLAAAGQPFNLSLLTVDTHHMDGYVCELCENVYSDQYSNVIACASRQVANFVQWVQMQDFYENTTIIIIGDHLSMDTGMIAQLADKEDYQRASMNIIINAPIQPMLPTTERRLATWDLFPTTLAALGVEIEGDRLGLGANLFSDVPTLFEEYGMEEVNDELALRSVYYDETFLFGHKITA